MIPYTSSFFTSIFNIINTSNIVLYKYYYTNTSKYNNKEYTKIVYSTYNTYNYINKYYNSIIYYV